MILFDDISGIKTGVNVDAIEDEEQFKALQKFMLDLRNIPTEEEMTEWVEGYEEFQEVLNELNKLNREIRQYARQIKAYGKPRSKLLRIDSNFKEVSWVQDRDIKNKQDVLEINIE